MISKIVARKRSMARNLKAFDTLVLILCETKRLYKTTREIKNAATSY